MIVCSCNVFSDADIKRCLDKGEARPKCAREVYTHLGCAPQCGRCAPTITKLIQTLPSSNSTSPVESLFAAPAAA